MSSLPTHLSGKQAQGLVAGEPIAQFEIGDMRNFVYLLIDWKTRQCAIIDPQMDLTPLRKAMNDHQLKPMAVLLTHTHHDHIGGLAELVRDFPDIQVHVNELDLHRIREPIRKAAKIHLVKEGNQIAVGDLKVQVLHTPGHSPGEVCYFIPAASKDDRPYVFTGDTIFIRDCGRTDLAGGSTVDLFDSIQRIKKYPQKTVILCGHHYQPEVASTIATEMVDSPPFRCRSVAELEALP